MLALMRWLDRIGWGSTMPPARRAALLRRDGEHLLACRRRYQALAREIKPANPAAVFEATRQGRL